MKFTIQINFLLPRNQILRFIHLFFIYIFIGFNIYFGFDRYHTDIVMVGWNFEITVIFTGTAKYRYV